ncbi:hypothetical protein [Emcibacter sp.]|uniref:hypothetical protein n=1 Tax=Emcibacter sp. TaxID=1979954 RepID=UPI003A943248
MFKKLFTAAGVLFLLAGTPLLAMAETPLTGPRIENFLDTWSPLQQLGEKYSLDFQNSPPPEVNQENGFNPFLSSLNILKGHQAYGEFMSILKGAGFSSPEEWATTANRVMRAYMASSFDAGEHSMSSIEIKDAIKQVQENPHISDVQKQAIINNLKNSVAAVNSMKNVSQDDLNAVKPYLGKIEETISEESK